MVLGKLLTAHSFTKRPAYSRKSFLIATMHKTLILAAESMHVDQDAVECAKKA